MERKLFGYPSFVNDEMLLTSYDNEYQHIMMDIRVYRLSANKPRFFQSDNEEIAVLLLKGEVKFKVDNQEYLAIRQDVFNDNPFAIHVCLNKQVELLAIKDSEVLVLKTHNDLSFDTEVYFKEAIKWQQVAKGMYGDVANRLVNTIFDKKNSPLSNMVLGEVITDKGNWSSYLPHAHPQPECYYFMFDRPEGFGASFVGDKVFKSVNRSFSAIPGGLMHPQSVAPGFKMYTCWMIRHLKDNPWTQNDRVILKEYEWLNQ